MGVIFSNLLQAECKNAVKKEMVKNRGERKRARGNNLYAIVHLLAQPPTFADNEPAQVPPFQLEPRTETVKLDKHK